MYACAYVSVCVYVLVRFAKNKIIYRKILL